MAKFSDMFKFMDDFMGDAANPTLRMESIHTIREFSDMEPGTEKEIVTTEQKADGTKVVTTISIKKTVKTVSTTTKKSAS